MQQSGLAKQEAHRGEQLAAVSDDDFEAFLAECRESERVASSDALTSHFIRKQQRASNSKNLAAIAAKAVNDLSGPYDAIVIDPPWPMQKIERDVRPN